MRRSSPGRIATQAPVQFATKKNLDDLRDPPISDQMGKLDNPSNCHTGNRGIMELCCFDTHESRLTAIIQNCRLGEPSRLRGTARLGKEAITRRLIWATDPRSVSTL